MSTIRFRTNDSDEIVLDHAVGPCGLAGYAELLYHFFAASLARETV